MNNARDILMQILAVIGSRNGAEGFVDDFCTFVEVQVMHDLIEALPQDKQNEVVDQFVTLPNEPQKAENILHPYYTREHLRKTLTQATQKAIAQQIVEPHRLQLTPSQRASILSLLEQLTC
jgi:hypothetical protein